MLRAWLLAVVTLLAFSASPLKAESAPVARVALAVGEATRVSGLGKKEQLQVGAGLTDGDRITTGKDAFAILVFSDQARVSLRADTELVIHRYRVDPTGVATQLDLELVRGAVRQISGEAARAQPERYRLNTPIAAIGVRGTDFLAKADQGLLETFVHQGRIVLLPGGGTNACADYFRSPGNCSPVATIAATDSMRYLKMRSTGAIERLTASQEEIERAFGLGLAKPAEKSEPVSQSQAPVARPAQDAAKTDAPKSETVKSEAPKTAEAPKTEVPKAEPPKAVTPLVEVSQGVSAQLSMQIASAAASSNVPAVVTPVVPTPTPVAPVVIDPPVTQVPVTPVVPTTPVTPVVPTTPVTPVIPVIPTTPVTPVVPTTPVVDVPTTPVTPTVPVPETPVVTPPTTVVTPPVEVVAPVVKPMPTQLVWGSFTYAASLPMTLLVPYDQARQNRSVTVGELGSYALWRQGPSGSLATPLQGQVQFNFAAGEAVLETATSVTAAEIKSAALAIDFDRAKFDASVGLNHVLTGTVGLNVSGKINDEGVFTGGDSDQRVAGAVSTDGKEAGFLFTRNHAVGVFKGVTLWTSK